MGKLVFHLLLGVAFREVEIGNVTAIPKSNLRIAQCRILDLSPITEQKITEEITFFFLLKMNSKQTVDYKVKYGLNACSVV